LAEADVEDKAFGTRSRARHLTATPAAGEGSELARGGALCFHAGVPRIRIVFPTAWDRHQLAARPAARPDGCELLFEEPADADCPADLDVDAFVDRAVRDWRGDTDAVFSASDYPGAAVAAAIGTGLGLPASDPAAVLRAAHKGLCREVAARILPDATPPFRVLDPDRVAASDAPLDVPLPCFVKPAKGAFSVLARRVASEGELRAFLRDPLVHEYRNGYLRIQRRLVERWLGPGVDARAFVAEGVLHGRMATVEGYCTGERAFALGVVDSLRHQATGSFTGFEYPSALPAQVCTRMEAIACRLAEALSLRWTMFNVEMLWDERTDGIGIVEINPRMCGQFADLYEKVDGVHGHRVALELAIGREPLRPRGRGAHAFAGSYPLRVFEPVRVVRAPSADDLAAAAALSPDALLIAEVTAGDELADFGSGEDGHSCRCAVVNVGAGSRAELTRQRDRVLARLDYRFAPVER
jgi:hypothetical protein